LAVLRAVYTECGVKQCGHSYSVNVVIVFDEFNYNVSVRICAYPCIVWMSPKSLEAVSCVVDHHCKEWTNEPTTDFFAVL